MHLIDTSAWIEYLRKTGSPANLYVRSLLAGGAEVVTTEPIIMELLAGPKDEAAFLRVERLVNGLPLLPLDARLDYRTAAAIYRTARRQGTTIRSMIDCLIAAVTLRTGVTLVHNDADYAAIATCFPDLQVRSN